MPDKKERETVVILPKKRFEELLLAQNNDELAKFIGEPLTAIAEMITGALAEGPKAWMGSAGRIAQGILKGKEFVQIGREIKYWRDKGRIPDDYADGAKHKFAYSWVELLALIDENPPDQIRLEGLMAMFYGCNKINASDGDKIVSYHLFQIAKKLTSGQLLYLKACHELSKLGMFTSAPQIFTAQQWFPYITKILGHTVYGLYDQDDRALIELGLLRERRNVDKSGFDVQYARLADLGMTFCENIRTYQIEKEG